MNEKLLACKIKPYTIELDEGEVINVKDEVWVGYWNRSGEFSAVCWDRIEDGRLVGGDSVTVTKEEFVEKVEKVIDIFGDTESYNVRYLLSLSQTQIADYDKRIAKLEKENAELEAQIEKMKCCGNCKHRYFIGDELECRLLDNGINCADGEKWEIKEND